MKRLLTLTLSVLLAATAFSQDPAVTAQDSLTQSLELENLRKIAFKDDSVVTTYSDGSTKTHKLLENEKLQFSLPDKTDKGIADDVYEKSRYAEPYEDGRFAKIKESRKAYYQKQNYSVDYESKTSDTVTVQKRDLLYRLPLITHL